MVGVSVGYTIGVGVDIFDEVVDDLFLAWYCVTHVRGLRRCWFYSWFGVVSGVGS